MVAWENNLPMTKHGSTYKPFHQKWLEDKQYSATMAKQSQFKEAVFLVQETAKAQEEQKSQMLLFAMLQKQHDKQMEEVMANNKANIEAMME